jgi:spermidine/putrescine transport system permease protein
VGGFEPTLPVSIYNFISTNLSPALNAIGAIVFIISVLMLIGAELLLIPLLVKRKA